MPDERVEDLGVVVDPDLDTRDTTETEYPGPERTMKDSCTTIDTALFATTVPREVRTSQTRSRCGINVPEYTTVVPQMERRNVEPGTDGMFTGVRYPM